MAKTPKPTRRSHFVHEAYLKGFTQSQDDKGQLWVYHLGSDRDFWASPNGVAVEKDFYTLENPSGDPLVVEKAYQQIEADVVPVIRGIQSSEALPSSDNDLAILHVFMAVQALRVPRTREFLGQLALQFAEMFERDLRAGKIRATDVPDGSEDELAAALAALDRGQIHAQPSKDGMIQAALQGVETAAPLIGQRHWSLVVATDDDPLIVSDMPLTIHWLSRRHMQLARARRIQPAFGVSGTLMTFPLTRRVGLMGTFEKAQLPDRPGPHAIRMMNAYTALTASRFVATSHAGFRWAADERRPTAMFADLRAVVAARNLQKQRAQKRHLAQELVEQRRAKHRGLMHEMAAQRRKTPRRAR